jgi:hypothetical protein
MRIIARLFSSSNIWKMNFVGNKGIRDLGINYLHLIPDLVHDLDFSDCNLSPRGIKTLCKFLEGNKTITRMVVWGNRINDEAAQAIGEMLAKNDTLHTLHIDPEGNNHIPAELLWICNGLESNRTLRRFTFAPPPRRTVDGMSFWGCQCHTIRHSRPSISDRVNIAPIVKSPKPSMIGR